MRETLVQEHDRMSCLLNDCQHAVQCPELQVRPPEACLSRLLLPLPLFLLLASYVPVCLPACHACAAFNYTNCMCAI